MITADGKYRIRISNRAGNESIVEFTIDKTVDFAINVNDKGLSNLVIASANESVTVTLIKNGELVEYTLGDEITEAGAYKVTVTDEVGNTAEYTFTIEKSLGAGAMIGIIFGCMILVGGIVAVILKKKEII